MRRKFSGLLSIVIVFTAVGLTAIYYYDGSWRSNDKVHFKPLAPMPAVTLPDQNTIKEIRQLNRRLPEFNNPAAEDLSALDLNLFGYDVMATAAERPNKKIEQVQIEDQINYALSFAFTSRSKRFCVIDGIFYNEGADLPDGGKILKIERNQVLIQKNKYTRWVQPMQPPEPDDKEMAQTS